MPLVNHVAEADSDIVLDPQEPSAPQELTPAEAIRRDCTTLLADIEAIRRQHKKHWWSRSGLGQYVLVVLPANCSFAKEFKGKRTIVSDLELHDGLINSNGDGTVEVVLNACMHRVNVPDVHIKEAYWQPCAREQGASRPEGYLIIELTVHAS